MSIFKTFFVKLSSSNFRRHTASITTISSCQDTRSLRNVVWRTLVWASAHSVRVLDFDHHRQMTVSVWRGLKFQLLAMSKGKIVCRRPKFRTRCCTRWSGATLRPIEAHPCCPVGLSPSGGTPTGLKKKKWPWLRTRRRGRDHRRSLRRSRQWRCGGRVSRRLDSDHSSSSSLSLPF